MCRILSLSGNFNNLEFSVIFKKFRGLSHCGNVPQGLTKGHKDGWGIAAYKNGKVIFFTKKACDAFRDTEYAKAIQRLQKAKPDLIIAHLRKASQGKRLIKNTHPFVIGSYSFCHNGTIFNSEKIPLNTRFRRFLKGETDSEKFFIYLLQLSSESKQKTRYAMREAIKKAIRFVKHYLDYTALNFILSDGKFLWALREINTKNETVRKKKLAEYYTLYQGFIRQEKTLLMCSEKLSLKGVLWRKFNNHELLELNLQNKRWRRLSI